jgi:hypothetical protein
VSGPPSRSSSHKAVEDDSYMSPTFSHVDIDEDDDIIKDDESSVISNNVEDIDYKAALEAMMINREINTDWGATRKYRAIKNKEKKLLAADLGIDLALETDRYSQFLDLAVNVVLPIGWKLEITPKGKVYYYSEFEGRYCNSHPCLDYFKKLMDNKYSQILRKHGDKVAKGSTERHTGDSRFILNLALNFFEGNNLICMSLFKIANKFNAGVQRNIFKDIDYLKSSLMRVYDTSYGYNLDVLRSRLKKLKHMRTVI